MATPIEAIYDFLETAHVDLKKYPHVLNVRPGTKVVNGVDTSEPCIRIYVDHKLPEDQLDPKEIIPKLLERASVNAVLAGVIPLRIKTDIVERKPDTFTLGINAANRLSPRQQDALFGWKHGPNYGYGAKTPVKLTGHEKDYRVLGQVTPTENQLNCGDCTAYGTKDHLQCRILVNTGVTDQLSAQHLFECSGGTCSQGNTIENPMNFLVNTGCALEQDCPTLIGDGTDRPCGQGLASDWYLKGKKLDSWKYLNDKQSMEDELVNVGPVTTGFDAHESIIDYTGGIYHSLGLLDPIAGGHCVTVTAVSDSSNCWGFQNSWGPDWGENGGFCRILMGDSNFDVQMFAGVPSASPPPVPGPTPPPGPTPSPCPVGNGTAKVSQKLHNFIPWLLHRKGRFHVSYLNPPE